MKILCLSNGHGEDAIAVNILKHLRQTGVEIAALPLVGKGKAYQLAEIPLIGETETLPSGGFIYMDHNQLWQDLQSGLLGLTFQQYQQMKQWVKQQQDSNLLILAVGDILPLFFAWKSGIKYAFIGTAKSDYYLSQASKGSIYYPWERWLMQSPRCLGVYPRDSLTAKNLARYPIKVFDYGNPMMDIFEDISKPINPTTTIVLLPGSRSPEAETNWSMILQGVDSVINTLTEEPLLFLAAIAPTVDLDNLETILLNHPWQKTTESIDFLASKARIFRQKQAIIALTQEKYSTCLVRGQIAIAMAGTATEQFIGLGKPAIAIPGPGPQYTRFFARKQQQLLGESLILVENPTEIGKIIQSLYQDTEKLAKIALNGQVRMGKPGASATIAKSLS
ncbi:MAG: hypothetical protein EA365_00210 [Gloeocapsa sp. DLM2.Bin57]|nr:MAG: hypothetical protein EA365_00210 [Gloeocapsa sp. DLM2.Bin57]